MAQNWFKFPETIGNCILSDIRDILGFIKICIHNTNFFFKFSIFINIISSKFINDIKALILY